MSARTAPSGPSRPPRSALVLGEWAAAPSSSPDETSLLSKTMNRVFAFRKENVLGRAELLCFPGWPGVSLGPCPSVFHPKPALRGLLPKPRARVQSRRPIGAMAPGLLDVDGVVCPTLPPSHTRSEAGATVLQTHGPRTLPLPVFKTDLRAGAGPGRGGGSPRALPTPVPPPAPWRGGRGPARRPARGLRGAHTPWAPVWAGWGSPALPTARPLLGLLGERADVPSGTAAPLSQ